jgi:peptidyl-prolyl cis-trans isomerase D
VKDAVDKASGGGDLAAIAKDLGAQIETTKAVTRYETDPAAHLTQPAAQEVFRLAVGKVQSVRVADGNVIVRPKEIQQADISKTKETLDRFGTQLDTMVGNDLVAQFLAALRQKYGVTVNQAVFAQAFAPQQQQQ